jgi:hypothetical protein
VPFAAQVAQVVGIAELEYLGLAADRVGELAAQRGTSSRQEPIPGRPATPDCLSLLTQSTVLGASANPWHPHGPRVRAPRDLPRPPVRAMARVSPEPEPCRRARAAGRSGASAASCRGRGRADAPTPGGLGGCVRAPGRHRPAQGSGSARSPPGERIDPGRLSLCRSPFCPTAALLLPGRAGPASAGGPASFRRGLEVGWGWRAEDRCLTARRPVPGRVRARQVGRGR